MRQEILRLDRVTVVQEGAKLLDSLSLQVFAGEILGLIPINAQGLEELLELIQHNTPLHYGFVHFDDIQVNDYRRRRSGNNPVAVIEKRSRLIGSMSVTDNIFVVRRGIRKYLISDRILADQLSRLCADLDLDLPAETPVERLPYFNRWVVELLKAVVSGARLVILRDISSAAGPVDLRKIHRIIHHFASRGLSFLYICNHHEETFTLCSRALLMEDGKILKNLRPEQMNDQLMNRFPQGFVRLGPLLTRESEDRREHPGRKDAPPVLRVEHLEHQTIRDLSFTLSAGECLTLLDLDNSLLTPLASLLRERQTPRNGRILLEGRPLSRAGRLVSFIDEKPTRSILFSDLSYLDNLCFLADQRLPLFWVRRRYRESIRREYLPLVGPVIDAPSLAGLSLQSLYELIYYRIRLQNPRTVFCIQPFAGIDMYQRLRIIQLLNMLRSRGIGVVILAVSLSDSLQVADRLLLIRKGRELRQIPRENFHLLDPSRLSKE